MAQIKVDQLTFHYETSDDIIFKNATFLIDTDWKLGFIGRNGRGKTTFLNLLMGKYAYQGSITSSVHFNYFPFEIKEKSKLTKNIAKEIIAPFFLWEQEMENCLKEENCEKTFFIERYGELQELYEKHNGYIIDNLLEKECAKLMLKNEILNQPFFTLSHGEQTKIMLMALFLKKNNFLLIDEPTNHLDTEGRKILSEYLNTKKGFILVSHDRTFLDGCVDHILCINQSTIEVQKGNFSSWQKNKTKKDQYEIQKNELLKKDISRLMKVKQQTANWSDKIEAGKIGSGSCDRGYIGHQAAKMMKRSKAIEQRQEKSIIDKKNLLKDVEQTNSLKINRLDFPKKLFFQLEDICLSFENRTILQDINLSLEKGERISLQGKNGSGKSTLLQLILGDIIPDSGKRFLAPALQISYIFQDTSSLSGNLEDFIFQSQVNKTIFKTILRQLGFSREQFTKNIIEFSEGQKKKVLLAKSLCQPSHLFIWDEPLNFIDVSSRIQLEEMILNYKPTMIFVEHDQTFCQKIQTRTFCLN